MCSSSRKAKPRTKYTYPPSASPWNKKILFTLWAVQICVSVFLSAFGGGMIALKNEDHRGDDGMSNFFYYFITLFVCGNTWAGIGYLLLQIHWYRRNELHPGWVLVISVCSVVCWLAVMLFTPFAIAYAEDKFAVFEAIEVLYIIGGVPYIAGLVYSSIVFARFRRERKGGMDVEIQSLDSRKNLT